MRKVIGVILVLCSVVSVSAQITTDEYSEKVTKLDKHIAKFRQINNYDSTAYYLSEKMRLFEMLPQIDKARQKSNKFFGYYSLACAYALAGKKSQSLDALEKSANAGLKIYKHVLSDSDLDNIRNEKRFPSILKIIKENSDFIKVLREGGKYTNENTQDYPKFSYAQPDDYRLKEVKKYFNLDSIAGNKDEISKIINLMVWVNKEVKHGPNWPFCEIDAVDIYNYHKVSGNGVNCRAIATVLNECYLAMGIKSRIIGCLPEDKSDNESHVINCVYAESLNKWLWIDPTNNAFVMDENNNMLSIAEVRERLINNKKMKLGDTCKRNIEEYLYEYMAKNLFRFHACAKAGFNVESAYRNTNKMQIQLVPLGYDMKSHGKTFYATSDDAYFWQLP
ncbi:transglutaminase domain-containing protein [Prevotella sp. 10(H)]|uniref:TPR end-of-group domain-containing protein n=1 Tax=Prevotella sp. 10(H) TaxID=1158294 RepID=UPI0004A6F49C|nr:transglutaminase domain-containing protein [Prevotella sp. 10(H)]